MKKRSLRNTQGTLGVRAGSECGALPPAVARRRRGAGTWCVDREKSAVTGAAFSRDQLRKGHCVGRIIAPILSAG